MKHALALLALALLSACGPRHDSDPPLHRFATERITQLSAEAHARDVNGLVLRVLDTHSMEPTLHGGDLIVVVRMPYATLKRGQIALYRARWLPADSPSVAHRLVQYDSHGWIASGDNNPRSESSHRVTPDNYLGVVVARYRTAS